MTMNILPESTGSTVEWGLDIMTTITPTCTGTPATQDIGEQASIIAGIRGTALIGTAGTTLAGVAAGGN